MDNEPPITALKSSLISVAGGLQHQMSEIRAMTSDRQKVKSDAHCIEELDQFLSGNRVAVKSLEKDILPILDSMLRPIRNTNMSLSEVVHALDKMIYLNYEIIEDVENEMGKYGYKRNPSHSPTRASESLSFQDYNTSDEVAKSNGMFQQSFNTQYQRNYHGHRSFTILSPLEEEDESLLNEDDEVGIVQSSPMIQTGNGTPRTPTMESLGLSPTSITIQSNHAHLSSSNETDNPAVNNMLTAKMSHIHLDKYEDFLDDGSDVSVDASNNMEDEEANVNACIKVGSPFEELLKSPEKPTYRNVDSYNKSDSKNFLGNLDKESNKSPNTYMMNETGSHKDEEQEVGDPYSSASDNSSTHSDIDANDVNKSMLLEGDSSTEDNTYCTKMERGIDLTPGLYRHTQYLEDGQAIRANHIDALVDNSLLIPRTSSLEDEQEYSFSPSNKLITGKRNESKIESTFSQDLNNQSLLDEICQSPTKPKSESITIEDNMNYLECALGANNESSVSPGIVLPEQEKHLNDKAEDQNEIIQSDYQLDIVASDFENNSVSSDYTNSSPERDPDIKSTVKARRISPFQGSDVKHAGKALFNDEHNTSDFSCISIKRSSLERTPKAAAWLAKHNMLNLEDKENLSNSSLNIIANKESNIFDGDKLSSDKHSSIYTNPMKSLSFGLQNPLQVPCSLTDNSRIYEVSNSEFDAAPRIVKMQVTLEEVNKAVVLINDWWKNQCNSQSKVSITEGEASSVLGKDFSPRKCKSILCALCHWKKMTIKIESNGTDRVFVGI